MGKEFIFPDLGEGITEGELVKWLVKVGDSVQEDQEVVEVETDKALVTIPSPYTGVVEKLNYQEGDAVQVGSVLMTFQENGEKAVDTAPQASTAEKPPPPQAESESPAPAAAPSIPIESAKSGLPPLATPPYPEISQRLRHRSKQP